MKLDLLSSPDFAVFTTRDYARTAGIPVASASRQLARLCATNRPLVQLTRGIWANTSHPHFSPMACVPVLVGNEQGYVSFLTALHLHGAISQIPAAIQVATTGHTRKLRTPVAAYDFLQIKPEMFHAGLQWSDTPRPFLMATVEKALFDTLYISTRRSRRFARLPELSLDDAAFEARKYGALVRKFNLPPQISAAMQSRFDALR